MRTPGTVPPHLPLQETCQEPGGTALPGQPVGSQPACPCAGREQQPGRGQSCSAVTSPALPGPAVLGNAQY